MAPDVDARMMRFCRTTLTVFDAERMKLLVRQLARRSALDVSDDFLDRQIVSAADDVRVIGHDRERMQWDVKFFYNVGNTTGNGARLRAIEVDDGVLQCLLRCALALSVERTMCQGASLVGFRCRTEVSQMLRPHLR